MEYLNKNILKQPDIFFLFCFPRKKTMHYHFTNIKNAQIHHLQIVNVIREDSPYIFDPYYGISLQYVR